MNKQNLYVDIHVLQTVPPSCVNRDDTGSPKTAVYGGVTRARVSSQSWKHAIRIMFTDIFEQKDIGIRTKHVVDIVASKIQKLNPNLDEKEAEKKAAEALKEAGLVSKEKKGKGRVTDALFFISDTQAEAFAQLVVSEEKEQSTKKNSSEKKGLYQKALIDAPAIDIALFGRMVANAPSLNYDAAAQVAHSISTHRIQNEYDFFTAVDDRAPEDNEGAGHLGTTEFNSSTLYRYTTVNVAELNHHLGKDTPMAVRGFAQAFLLSMPTGKQNSFANRTLPDAVYVTVRRDQPINCAGAFEKPVLSGSNGYLAESEKQFVSYVKHVYQNFVNEPEAAFGIGTAEAFKEIAEMMPLQQMLDTLEDRVTEYITGDGESI